MAIYDTNGNSLNTAYGTSGASLDKAYDINGIEVFSAIAPLPDYNNYSYVQMWRAFPAVNYAQGFDVYDNKVFWVSKSDNSTISADCYVLNLSDGLQALDVEPVTVYSYHGNNVSINYPKVYFTTGYSPSSVYVNEMSSDFKTFALTQTLIINDGTVNCDACLDESDKTIMWTLGHTAGSSDPSAPFRISKWDLTDLTDNGDGTYTPKLLQTVDTPQSSSSFYIQGCKSHDGLLWYANGIGTTNSYVRALNPNTGEELYTIDCNTTNEPEGLSWVEDDNVIGGYVLYVGFAAMVMRKYTFGAL